MLLIYQDIKKNKWVHLAIYWTGIGFKKYRPDFASIMRLHSLEYRPTYYNFAKGFFDRFIETHQFIDINKLTNKTVCDMLLKYIDLNPRIVDEYREINFKEAFTSIANRFIDPEVKGFI